MALLKPGYTYVLLEEVCFSLMFRGLFFETILNLKVAKIAQKFPTSLNYSQC